MTGARLQSGPRRPCRAPEQTDAIGAWLDRLVRLARLPAREAGEIRDELDAHLRERVRDLMLAGSDEPEAIHKSISELGDLALLAQRYRDASRIPKRRLTMNVAIITAASAALGLSTLALQQSRDAPPAQPEPGHELALADPEQPAGVPILGGIPIVSQFFRETSAASAPIAGDIDESLLVDLFHVLAESQDLRPYVHWRDLEPQQEDVISDLPLEGQTLERAIEMINDALALEGASRIQVRVEGGLLEIASQRFFDRRESELVTYDVSSLLAAEWPLEVTTESEVLVELITNIVEPESWPNGGGDVAAIYAVGGKLFISGPPRIHERVAWLLGELMGAGEEEASAREQVLQNFLLSVLAAQDPDPAAHPAGVVRELLDAAQSSPAAADPVVERTLRDAIRALSTPRAYPLKHTAASELAPILAGALAPIGGEVVADPSTNSLIVNGDAEAQAKAAAILDALDRDPNADPRTLREPEQNRLPDPASRSVSLRLRAEGDRIVAEILENGVATRVEAADLEITTDALTGLIASHATVEAPDGSVVGAGLFTLDPTDR